MRRKEDRAEDVQSALGQAGTAAELAAQGANAGGNAQYADALNRLAFAIEKLAGLANEDPYEFTDHNLTAGRHDQPNDFPNDGRFEGGTLAVRTLKLGDIGDPPDIMMGRVGPDGVDYDYGGEWQEVPEGTSLGSIYGVAWNENTQWSERSAQMTFRKGPSTGTGSIHFFTNGNERFVITPGGRLDLTGLQRSVDAQGEFVEVIVDGQPRKLRLG